MVAEVAAMLARLGSLVEGIERPFLPTLGSFLLGSDCRVRTHIDVEGKRAWTPPMRLIEPEHLLL